MPSPITTGGFQGSVLPSIRYNDPSLMVTNLAGILPAASQGLSFANQLQQIRDDSQARPVRQRLQEIALQSAEQRLANGPLEAQLARIQLAKASQPIERIIGTELSRVPRINSPYDAPALDDNGNPTFEEGDTNYDLTPIQKVEVTDPISGIVRIEERKLTPIATSETLSDRSENQELKRLREESLAAARDLDRKLAIDRINNPSWKRIGYGVNPVTGKQGYLIMNEKTREIQEIPSDLVPVPTGADALTGALNKLVGGANTATENIAVPAQVVSVAPSKYDTPANEEPESDALVSDLTKAFSGEQAAPKYPSADAVKSAVRSGALTKAEGIKILREQFGFAD